MKPDFRVSDGPDLCFAFNPLAPAQVNGGGRRWTRNGAGGRRDVSGK
jgi:hypothetical protein